MNNKVVVLGSTGMAGHVIVQYLCESGYDVYCTSRSAPDTSKSRAINAEDTCALAEWLDMVEPDVIVNCIGILPKQAIEYPHQAIFLNAYLPQWLLNRYLRAKVKVIHLSTDCVFSGTKGNYIENDVPDGNTIYDRTKVLGEISNQKDLTFRMSIIGPDISKQGVGLFNWFMQQTGEVKGYTKAIWNGITTIELARAIDAAIKQDLSGLYQLVPNQKIDKYHLLRLFQDVFNKNEITIVPYDVFCIDKSLVNTRTDFDFELRSYEQQIQDMRAWIHAHKSLYHY